MADAKISALTELAEFPAATDEFVVVDKSDTSMAATGTDKRVTRLSLMPLLSFFAPLYPVIASTPASVVTGVANTWYSVRCAIPGSPTLTGIRYRVGTASAGNVRVALYDNSGTKVADATSDTAQIAANGFQSIPFDTPPTIAQGLHIMLIWFSSAAASFYGVRYLQGGGTGTNATTTPTSISLPTTANADRPVMTFY